MGLFHSLIISVATCSCNITQHTCALPYLNSLGWLAVSCWSYRIHHYLARWQLLYILLDLATQWAHSLFLSTAVILRWSLTPSPINGGQQASILFGDFCLWCWGINSSTCLLFDVMIQSFQGPQRLLRTDTEKVETRMGERERCQVLKISPEFWVQLFLKIIYFYSLNISPFLIFKYMSQKTLSLSFKLSQSFCPSQYKVLTSWISPFPYNNCQSVILSLFNANLSP